MGWRGRQRAARLFLDIIPGHSDEALRLLEAMDRFTTR